MTKAPIIEIYKSKKNKQFAWRCKASNNKKIACGGETYHNKKDLLKTIQLLGLVFKIVDLTV
jgi:uncharacterized protein YegP (UPF0339 family)